MLWRYYSNETPFRPFDTIVVKNYLFSSGLQKDTGIFVVKFLSPLGVKGYKAHGHEEIHLPMVYKGVS